MDFTIRDDEERIILALSPSRTYRENNLRMMKEIQKIPDLRTIIICVNHPESFLIDFYARNGIDISRIYFIDAITHYATGTTPKPVDNCRFVSRPGDLTAMSVAITSAIKEFENEKTIIFLDSVNAMLIYTDSVNLTKFIHFVISKLRVMNITGVLFAVEKGLDPMLLSQIMMFADDMFEFPEETTA